jgi:hypothetical protein
MLIMAPAFAFAGSYSIAVTSGSTTGSVGPAPLSGYASATKTFTAAPATNYALSTVTRNGVDVTANTTYVNGTTITIPLSSASQTFYVGFAKAVQVTPTLSAVLPSAITIPAGTATALSGGNSIISNLNSGTQATFTFSGASLTFSTTSGNVTNPINITTNVTAAAAGTYTGTLTLTAPNATPSSANVTITVQPAGVGASNACLACHTGWQQATDYAGSVHANSSYSTCQACHNNSGTENHPFDVNTQTVSSTNFVTTGSVANVATGAVYCTLCHNGSYPIPHPTGAPCAGCHTPSGTGDAHALQPSSVVIDGTCSACHVGSTPSPALVTATNSDCVGCHNVAISHPGMAGSLVNDNGGVRAITGANGEFDAASTRNNTAGYRSHHIYNGAGADPQNAQCIACHLEGTVGPNRSVVLDPTYHMADAKIHLRSSNSAIANDFAWDPMHPDHTGMDNFCMSCHNAAGAVTAFANISSALKGMTPITGALAPSAKNPFGDLLKNAYDGLTRPQVVAVYEQFDTGNISHHAVRGQKYTSRTRAASTATDPVTGAYGPALFTQYSGATQGTIHIVPPTTGTPQVEQYFGNYSTSSGASGYGPLYSGSRKTLYEANLFVAQYTTLSGTTLGDDSTLHCGDCHSVGQWKPGSTVAVTYPGGVATQVATTAVIGAHGSQNEYMLRTSNGTDALHTQGSTATSSGTAPNIVYTPAFNGTYVCYLCHRQDAYGDNNYFRTDSGVGTTSFRDHAGLHYSNGCDSSAQQSVGKVGYTNRIAPLGGGSGKLGTAFGYTCGHCHSSGNAVFGGIHGNAAADGSAKNITFLTYSTDSKDIIGSTLPGGYASRSYNTEHDTLNFVARLPYRFMGGTGLRYNGGATAGRWEAKTLNGKHREGCYNLSATTATTNLWNTTNPIQSLAGGPGGNAIVNNGGNDDAIPSAGNYNNRTAQNNNTSAGWGSCNHHQGSTTTSSTAPTRSVQRPLVY